MTIRKLRILAANLGDDERVLEAFNGRCAGVWASTAVVLTKTRALILNEDERDLGGLFFLMPPTALLDHQVHWEDVKRVDTAIGTSLQMTFVGADGRARGGAGWYEPINNVERFQTFAEEAKRLAAM